MSWSDFYRRRDTLNGVLGAAERDPGQPLPCVDGFDGPEALARALHHKWLMKLTGYIDVACHEIGQDPGIDRVDAISSAWHRTAAENPVLRAVLDWHADEYPDALGPGLNAERRLLALAAGLALPVEPAEEITRIGAAFMALLASSPRRTEAKRGRIRLSWSRLLASARPPISTAAEA